jgi:hypothetical protein
MQKADTILKLERDLELILSEMRSQLDKWAIAYDKAADAISDIKDKEEASVYFEDLDALGRRWDAIYHFQTKGEILV